MSKLTNLLLMICGAAAVGGASIPQSQAQAPIGRYGTWSSSQYPGSGGQIQLTNIQIASDGTMQGRIFFTGSPCAQWADFGGRTYGNSAQFSMIVGPCGVTQVMLQWQGNAWIGSYISQYPDSGMVQMLP